MSTEQPKQEAPDCEELEHARVLREKFGLGEYYADFLRAKAALAEVPEPLARRGFQQRSARPVVRLGATDNKEWLKQLQGGEWGFDVEADPDWPHLLQRGLTGVTSNEYNVAVALTKAPEFAGALAWDVRRKIPVALKETPAGPAGKWTAAHTARANLWLQQHRVPSRPMQVTSALLAITQQCPIDPLGGHARAGLLPADWEEAIARWLVESGTSVTTVDQVAKEVLGLQRQAITRSVQSKVGRIMRRLGFLSRRPVGLEGRRRELFLAS